MAHQILTEQHEPLLKSCA